MEDIKLSLTIVLPGSTMMSEQECSKNPQNYNHHSMTIGSHKDRKTISFSTRKCKPARMVINMGKDTYNYMTAKSKNRRLDAQNCPGWSKPDIWFPLSVEQRLKKHLQRIVSDKKGISYTYTVFED